MPILVLALGIGSILLLLTNNRIQQSLIAPDVGSLRAVAEIQTRVTVVHLWIEEYVTGDEVDLDEIESSLARAERLVLSLEERSAVPSDTAFWSQLLSQSQNIRTSTARVAAGVRRFSRLTDERRAAATAGADVGVGSEVDVGYDRAFGELDNALGELERALVLRLTASERRAALLFRGLLLAWSLIVLLAAAGLWTRERRQRATETALGDSQAQLLQAQKMEAVGQLAGGLAHDINNYLAAIAAQSELVKMKAEPGGTTAKRMDAILATTGRASALIERLLAFSRRQPARPVSVDPNLVLTSLDDMLRQLLGEDITLEKQLAQDLWPVEIDLSQLEQIVLNLAVNAREAMARGGTLSLTTRNVPASPNQRRDRENLPSDRIAITVSDTGSGIPAALRRKIFEPFFTTKQKTHSGLGLATVLGIVEQNGGRISFDSNENGTRFEILLPRSPTAPLAGPAELVTAPAEASYPNLPRASERILLVEDNEEVRRSTRDLLESLGYTVAAVALGQEAISTFAPNQFDLLVTDVVMPGLSGREVAEKLQDIDPGLPVLFISGNTDDGVLRHGLEAGSVDLLPKPFSARQLAERVRATLSRAKDPTTKPGEL